MKRRSSRFRCSSGLLAVICGLVVAQQASAQAKKEPVSGAAIPADVATVLTDKCADCHGRDAPEGQFDVTSWEALLAGGDQGRAIVPGDPEGSLLWRRIQSGEMPPEGEPTLTDEQKETIRRWIAEGEFPSPRAWEVLERHRWVRRAQEHWAFRPVGNPAVPKPRDATWPAGAIDCFVRWRLEQAGLVPAPDADPSSLLRRAYLDLTGLPPTVAEVEDFLRESQRDREQAWVRLVDRLLASPAFGERWGRHWLDVARYADTIGGGQNYTLNDAWRYRDYVIAAFNADLPYDRFLTEQIAGDLLPYDSPKQHQRQLIATGFLALGPKDFTDQDKVKLLADTIDEQMDTLGKAFLGLAIGCARCHSHKFDPIPLEDYYALAGVFYSTQTLEELDDTRKFANMPRWNHIPLPTLTPEEQERIRREYDARTESLRQEKKKLQQRIDKLRRQLAKRADAASEPPELEELERRLEEVSERIRGRLALKNYFGIHTLPTILGVLEKPNPTNARIHIGGNPRQLGPEVPRRLLRAIGPEVAIPADRSGRLELARWLTHPDHPLTARVLVNRVWAHLMGAGIVRSVDNFGTTGSPPSHPELLDYLARQFIDDGWSVKRLIRRIMLTRTYRMASVRNAQAQKVDPENRWLWQWKTRRLEAEVLRDAMLAIGGRLDRTPGGPTLVHIGDLSLNYREEIARPGLWNRRTVYLPVYRNMILEPTAMCTTFDFADPNVVIGHRTASIVPTQALFFMNHPLVYESAASLARRLLRTAPTDRERIRLAYLSVYHRSPDLEECEHVREFLEAVADDAGQADDPTLFAWTSFCQTLFCSAEFLLLH